MEYFLFVHLGNNQHHEFEKNHEQFLRTNYENANAVLSVQKI